MFILLLLAHQAHASPCSNNNYRVVWQFLVQCFIVPLAKAEEIKCCQVAGASVSVET